MDCENYLCIYEQNGKCILETVTLNINGTCNDCTYFNITDNLLNELKLNTLNKLNRE